MKFIKFFSVLVFLNGIEACFAQQSVNTSGANGSGSGGSVSLSIGQVVYNFTTGTTGQVNQGVQQPVTCTTVQGVQTVTSCSPLTWINGVTYTSSNNSATHLIVGGASNGCDSLVTLNFTLWACTQLQSGDCGAIGVTADQTLRAINVNAPQYRFRVTGPNNNGPGWSNGSYLFVSPNRSFKFSNIPGVVWGQTFVVDVAVGDGTGNFGPYGVACTVTLANNIPTTQLDATSCGATGVQQSTTLRANSVTNAISYRFRISGVNSGGAGWNNNVFILDRPTRDFKMNMVPGIVLGQTYDIQVAVMLQGGSVYGPYGNSCNVTMQAPGAQLEPGSCGATNVPLGSNIWANAISGSVGYRFRITGPNTGTTGWSNNTYILDRPTRDFKFNMVPGVIWNQTYSVQVAVSFQTGIYGGYGNSCNVTLENPTTQLEAVSCGATGILLNTLNRANIVSGALGYRFRITGPNTGATGWSGNVFILNRPNRDLKFNMFQGAIAGQTYQIEVAVLHQDGTTYGPYGSICTLTISNTLNQDINQDDMNLDMNLFEVSASHNPFTTDFGMQVLTNRIDEFVHVTIYDMSGKQIETQSIAPLDIEGVRFGANLASGMYLVEVRQGMNKSVIRQVKH